MFEPLPYKEGPVIYYLAPDYDEPSWGNALLYLHVELLCKNGFQAAVIHHKRPYRFKWFKSNVKIVYLNNPQFRINQQDILVVPEANVMDDIVAHTDCRKIVFVQNAFVILARFEHAYRYDELGYEHAIATMPHMKSLVEKHFGAKVDIIPPLIAPYFFLSEKLIKTQERAKQIVIFPKWLYLELGHIDYNILIKLLDKIITNNNKEWEVVKLVNKSHKQVSKVMKKAAFFINVNTIEGFNVTVAEAMAAGCIPICYDAYGGHDYLKNNVNAYVFKNNHIYTLAEKLFYLIDNYENSQIELSNIRNNAYSTALCYTDKQMEESLLNFYSKIIN